MLFLADDLWTTIDEMKEHAGPRRIAVAYLSSDQRFRLRGGDIAIVDASDNAIRTGQTSASILDAADKAGATLFSNDRLHAKVIITSAQILVGSANISQNSPKLFEAAVVSSDGSLRSGADAWWDFMVKQSVRIDRSFINRIKKIPVAYHGTGSSEKPTLAQALEEDLPVLKDYLYSWTTSSAELNTRIVGAAAKKMGLLPARIPAKSWDWYEWEYQPNLLKAIRKEYQGKPCVNFLATTDTNDEVDRIKTVEQETSSFIGAFALKGHIVMVSLNQNAPGLRLKAKGWRRQLGERLTCGLQKIPKLRKQLSGRHTAIITLNELRDLYRAGAE